MDPGQQSSSPKPFSEEETQLFYSIRDSMDETFRYANALGKAGLWQEVSRRLEAFKHRRSPQELEAKFGQYKPKRPRKKKRKRAVPPANEQEQAQCSGGPKQSREEEARDRLARSQGVETASKRLLEEIDLDAFFSEENCSKSAAISLRLGRSETEFAQ